MRRIDVYRKQIELGLVLGGTLAFWFAFALAIKRMLS